MRKKTILDLGLLIFSLLCFTGALYLRTHTKLSLQATKNIPQTQGMFFAETTIASPIDTGIASRAAELSHTISANAYLVMDAQSKQVLLEHGSRQHFYPASTTKIITALLASELYAPQQPFTITNADLALGKNGHLRLGETYTLEQLLAALLIESANEAGTTLANHSQGGYEDFVKLMNKKAQALNLVDSYFTNPQGYDDSRQQSSARDLAIASLALLRQPILRTIVAQPSGQIISSNGVVSNLVNTNQLYFLNHPYQIKGIKTGTEKLAQEVLVSLLEKDNHQLLIVVLSSRSRYNDTLSLANFTFANFIWQSPDRIN